MAYQNTVIAFFVTMLVTTPVLAHEGGTHVMGTVSVSESDHLVVQGTDGKEVSIILSPGTRYRAAGAANSSATPKVGDRVVVEVTKDSQGLTASEVRFSTVAPKKSP
jgi:hypothetical protein